MGNNIFRSKPVYIFENPDVKDSSIVNYQDYTPEDLQNMSPSELKNFYQDVEFNQFDCSNCKWQNDNLCSLNNTYDTACHGNSITDPHDITNTLETHGYVCLDPETSIHCNHKVCKDDTLTDKCKITQLDHTYEDTDTPFFTHGELVSDNKKIIVTKPNKGDPWISSQVEFNCLQYIQDHVNNEETLPIHVIKDKCSHIFNESLNYTNQHYSTYCQDFIKKFPLQDKFNSHDDCINDFQESIKDIAKYSCNDTNRHISYSSFNECYNDITTYRKHF